MQMVNSQHQQKLKTNVIESFGRFQSSQHNIGQFDRMSVYTAYKDITEIFELQNENVRQLISSIARFDKNLFDRKNLTILDMGCTFGLVSFALQNYARHIVGIDSEEEAINLANCYKKYRGLNHIDFFVEDAIHIPSLQQRYSRYFDLIISKYVIEHVASLENLEQMLQNTKKIMKPNGTLFIEMPNHIFPFEGHLKIPIPPLASKKMIIWLGKLFGKIRNKEQEMFVEQLNIVSTKRVEAIFNKLHFNYINIYEEGKLKDIFFGNIALSERYRFVEASQRLKSSMIGLP